MRECLGHQNSSGKSFIPPKTFTDDERIKLGKNILSAYQQIHKKRFFHRDINPANIRIDPKTLKVSCIDFGEALKMDSDKPAAEITSVAGVPAYTAPEIKDVSIKNPLVYTEKNEVYALGKILNDLFFNQEEGEPLSPPTNHSNQGLRNLITAMTDPEPTARPTLANVTQRLEKLSPTRHRWRSGGAGLVIGAILGGLLGPIGLAVGAVIGAFCGMALENYTIKKQKQRSVQMPPILTPCIASTEEKSSLPPSLSSTALYMQPVLSTLTEQAKISLANTPLSQPSSPTNSFVPETVDRPESKSVIANRKK